MEASSITKPRRGSKPQPLDAARIPDALLTVQNVCVIAGMSPSTLYRRAAADPTFPRLIRLGARATRVRAGDLTRWLAAQAGAQ